MKEEKPFTPEYTAERLLEVVRGLRIEVRRGRC
jgi:hypothetical protein